MRLHPAPLHQTNSRAQAPFRPETNIDQWLRCNPSNSHQLKVDTRLNRPQSR